MEFMAGQEQDQVDIPNTIREVVRDHKIAAIMTMQDLNQALHFADTFIFIKNSNRVYSRQS